jgi:hypothetical protein
VDRLFSSTSRDTRRAKKPEDACVLSPGGIVSFSLKKIVMRDSSERPHFQTKFGPQMRPRGQVRGARSLGCRVRSHALSIGI